MKKLLITTYLVLVCTISGFSQVSYGTYTMFPNKKLMGSYYKPQLGFGKVNDQYVLVLCYTDPEMYASFDEESVMLLKYADGTTVKLPISKQDKITKKYESIWDSMLKKYYHFYKTFTSFDLDQENIDRIVKNHDNIIKIRISFTNGDIKDWDIDQKYQPKLIKGLVESFNSVKSKDAVRKENIDNVEAGF